MNYVFGVASSDKALEVANRLINASAWFECAPYPDGAYCFTTRQEMKARLAPLLGTTYRIVGTDVPKGLVRVVLRTDDGGLELIHLIGNRLIELPKGLQFRRERAEDFGAPGNLYVYEDGRHTLFDWALFRKANPDLYEK